MSLTIDDTTVNDCITKANNVNNGTQFMDCVYKNVSSLNAGLKNDDKDWGRKGEKIKCGPCFRKQYNCGF